MLIDLTFIKEISSGAVFIGLLLFVWRISSVIGRIDGKLELVIGNDLPHIYGALKETKVSIDTIRKDITDVLIHRG